MKRMRPWVLLFALTASSAGAAGTVAATGTVAVPVPPPRPERIVPLGPAEVREQIGSASLQRRSPAGLAAPQALLRGATVSGEVLIKTAASPPGRVELRFADGSLLRLDQGTTISLLPAQRQIALHAGRLLVVADRMVGGVTVLTAGRAFVPEGTSFLVEADAGPSASGSPAATHLTVLEGAVCACTVAVASPPPNPAGQPVLRPTPGALHEQMVLPGETWHSAAKSATGPAATPAIDLGLLLRTEPLVSAFPAPLPSLAKIAELADQQRRKLLLGRNARLRREIFWKRPPRAPLRLPALFADPNRVTVRYE